MATFIKGNAIENATGYELYKVNGDEGYIPIVSKVCGEVKFTKQERIGTNGAFQATANYWMRSDFIDVTDLADNEDGYCTKVNGDAYPDYLHIAFYTEKDNASSFVGGNFYGETTDHQTTLTAEAIKTIADGYGANYVVIASDTQYEGCEELLVTLTNEINFRLDGLGFGAGTHQLVVKAIAPTEGVDTDDDGEIDTIYTDSEYGGDADGNPVVYKVGVVTGDITSQFEWTEGYRMTADTGDAEVNAHWITSDYVDISAYSKLQMTMPVTNVASTNSGCAFYDADKKYISGVNVTFGATTMGVETKDITVPAGAVYIRTMWYSTNHTAYTPDFAVENFNCLAEV